jgi:hypothetical protein
MQNEEIDTGTDQGARCLLCGEWDEELEPRECICSKCEATRNRMLHD